MNLGSGYVYTIILSTLVRRVSIDYMKVTKQNFDGHKEDEWMTLCDWIDERVDYLFPGFEYGYSLSEEKTKKLMAEYNQEYNTLLEELRDLSTALCRITKE
jgi:hypothetical protein